MYGASCSPIFYLFIFLKEIIIYEFFFSPQEEQLRIAPYGSLQIVPGNCVWMECFLLAPDFHFSQGCDLGEGSHGRLGRHKGMNARMNGS